jgi:hypothetical protein
MGRRPRPALPALGARRIGGLAGAAVGEGRTPIVGTPGRFSTNREILLSVDGPEHGSRPTAFGVASLASSDRDGLR